MRHRAKFVVVSLILFLIMVVISGVYIYNRFAPSSRVMDLKEYYDSGEDNAVIILEDRIYEQQGIVLGDQVYIDIETTIQYLNERFYWDQNEKLLIYTTPTQLIKMDLNSTEYSVNGKTEKSKDNIVMEKEGKIYVSLDFIKLYSNIKYEKYTNPQRVVIQYIWDKDILYTTVKKNTQVRYQPNIKSDILKQVKKDSILRIIIDDEEVHKKFTKVITEDGIIGYIKNSYIGDTFYDKPISDFQEPEYTSIKKDYKINMVFHQVTNQTANNNMLSLINRTKGVTTLSPTWFKVKNEDGEIDSLASETYVDRAHNMGVEVWGLVDDFTFGVNMKELLSYTSRREKLASEIVSLALQYKLDGINLDFEKIPESAAADYTQFLREISIMCRNNSLVLSVDNYVPSVYTDYYNRSEQGKIVDYVITMAYDEHITTEDGSGSVASISFVSDAIKNVLDEVPKEKNIIAIPFYTRLWEESGNQISSKAYSMYQAEEVLKANGVVPEWDNQTGQLYGEYKKDGSLFKIWLEEEKSIEEKMKVISNNDVAGIASWKLGLEKKEIWDTISKYLK